MWLKEELGNDIKILHLGDRIGGDKKWQKFLSFKQKDNSQQLEWIHLELAT